MVCPACKGKIECPKEIEGQKINCPICQRDIFALVKQPKIEKPKIQKFPKVKSKTDVHLEFIRENSCYKMLRLMINISFGLILAADALAAIGYFSVNTSHDDATAIMVAKLVGIIGLLSISILLILSIRQSCLVAIDIADTLLHEHSKDSK